MIKSNIPSGNSSGIRVDGYNDMVQVYDPYKKSWVDYQNTGVIVLPSTIIITTTTLNGQPVTCVIGDYYETTVFVDGVATFKNIFTTGTATVTSGEFSVEVAVSETGGSYEGVLEEVVELVLWDGTSFQNGAIDYNARLKYVSSSGDFKNKKLCFVPRKSVTIYLLVRAYVSDSQIGASYVEADGSFSNNGNPITTKIGTKLLSPLNDIKFTPGYDIDYVSELRIETASASFDTVYTRDYFSKISIV